MNTFARGAAALLFCVYAPFAAAKDTGEPITDCVTIGQDHQILRTGGPQSILLKDGDSHYRVSLQNTCDSLAIASRIDITTEGQANRLCPAGSVLETNRDSCRVSKVATISAEEFATKQRRVRR
ncbi:MAG TPA: hypothetical protein VEY92_00235 [Pseudoxanthomonas sp.]|nr:hypothetical protein [Pseudoxanthomonas sp.]